MARGRILYYDTRHDGWCASGPERPVHEEFRLSVHRAGFPLLALQSVEVEHLADRLAGDAPTPDRLKWTSLTYPGTVAAWAPMRLRFSHDLPLQPLWGGLAANSAIYASLLWTLTLGPRAARRWHRRRALRCLRCGYPIGAAPECTECGSPVSARPIGTPPA